MVHFVYYQGWIPRIPSFLYETTLLMAFITGLIFAYLYRSGTPSFFVRLYLLSMVVKLLACLTYNLIMVMDDRQGAVMNVVYFLLTYFIFTAVEIGFLYRKISGSSKP